MLKAFLRIRRAPTRGHYETRGYQVFRKILPADEVVELAALARSFRTFRGSALRQSGKLESNDFFPGTDLVRNPLLNAHLPISDELTPIRRRLNALVASPQLAGRLRQLDGADRYNIHQTLLFFTAQTTGLHLDSWGLDTSPRGFAHTVWIPLQDITFRSGVPALLPWPLGKVITESELELSADGSFNERYERYHQALSAKLLEDSPEIATVLVRRGDVMVWSSLTPHFTMPSDPFPIERLSIQILVQPTHLWWGNFLDQPQHRPTTRAIRMTNDFSYFVHEDTSKTYGIEGDER
jgi:hypothetical protein